MAGYISDPDYLNVVLTFVYRGFKIQITRDRWQGQEIYTAWANYHYSSAVAVPRAVTTKLAIRNAKRWVDKRIKE
ncbi:MAG: hypothetical protein Tsb0014_44790 [Pleurocapsa sp.]